MPCFKGPVCHAIELKGQLISLLTTSCPMQVLMLVVSLVMTKMG